MTSFEKSRPLHVLKAQDPAQGEDLGLVFGWAMVCSEGGKDYFDEQGDNIPEDAMLKALADYEKEQRLGEL